MGRWGLWVMLGGWRGYVARPGLFTLPVVLSGPACERMLNMSPQMGRKVAGSIGFESGPTIYCCRCNGLKSCPRVLSKSSYMT